MEYAIYIALIAALLLGLFLYRRRQTKELRDVLDDHYTTSRLEPGCDPIHDRLEIHRFRDRS